MCTLSVITRDDGYLLAMNRDEKIARGAGGPPHIYQVAGTNAVYPTETGGGTWIAANEYGITLALLNWNDGAQPRTGSGRVRSRGEIIPALAGSSSLEDLQTALAAFDLERVSPFRLFGVIGAEKAIAEWRWNSAELETQIYGWKSQHQFSSSLSDEQAGSLRGSTCISAANEPDAGTVPWLRRLHASHAGGPGPFSVCVHREDVKTLSYSEVAVTPSSINMSHFRGSPCTIGSNHPIESMDLTMRIGKSAVPVIL